MKSLQLYWPQDSIGIAWTETNNTIHTIDDGWRDFLAEEKFIHLEWMHRISAELFCITESWKLPFSGTFAGFYQPLIDIKMHWIGSPEFWLDLRSQKLNWFSVFSWCFCSITHTDVFILGISITVTNVCSKRCAEHNRLECHSFAVYAKCVNRNDFSHRQTFLACPLFFSNEKWLSNNRSIMYRSCTFKS